MRISIFTDSFLPYTSGVTYSVLNQARELVRRGHEISIFRPKPGRGAAPAELPHGVELYDVPFAVPIPRVPQLRITLPSFITSLRRLRKINPDIVHLNTEWGCGWEGLVASRLLGKPTIGTFHTFFAEPGYLKSFGLPPCSWLQSLMWGYSVFFFNTCRRVTSPSQAVKQSLLDHGIRSEPVLIPNGIPLPEPIDWRQVKRERMKLQIYGPSFVYVGRMSPEKSLPVVLEAFAQVQRRRRRARLVMIGDGPSLASLKNQAQELGIASAVEFLGHVEHDRLISERLPLLGDAFVTASKTENQPMSILEAMAMGLPVIGAAAKGIPELVNDGTNGLLFEPDNPRAMASCMLRMAAHTKRRRTMGQQAMLTAANYNMSHVVDRLESLYQETISRSRQTRPVAQLSLDKTAALAKATSFKR
ncbi:MAG: glycosyltransferase [Planctomycetota bacterium]|nr:glycosyltransferase [Blastopirellula sp.]